MSEGRILLTGGSGFHGSAIRLAVERQMTPLSLLLRDSGQAQSNTDTRIVKGDLTDVSSLRVALEGTDTVIHAGGYIGYDEGLCREVNTQGTANLVNAAQAVGVRNLLYVSTTAVYGSGPHRGVAVGEIAPSPNSVLSRSRLEAEKLVLAAGGTVIRPGLVYGVGDRWVVPSMIQMTKRLGGEIERGQALLSIIRVDDLANLIVFLAGTDLSQASSRTWHASNKAPVSVDAVLQLLRSSLAQELPRQDMSRQTAIMRARSMGLSVERVELLSNDRWYVAHEIWEAAGLRSPVGPSLGDAEVAWYRTLDV